MRQKDGRLLESDDSDVPDLDLPLELPAREKRSVVFGRNQQKIANRRHHICSSSSILVLLLFAIVASVIALGLFTIYFLDELAKLKGDKNLSIVLHDLVLLKRDINRLKVDLDVIHWTVSSVSSQPSLSVSSPLNGSISWPQSRNISAAISDRFEGIEQQLKSITDGIHQQINELKAKYVRGCAQGYAVDSIDKHYHDNDDDGTKSSALKQSIEEKSKRKRSKLNQSKLLNDAPIVFTRTKNRRPK